MKSDGIKSKEEAAGTEVLLRSFEDTAKTLENKQAMVSVELMAVYSMIETLKTQLKNWKDRNKD